MKSLELPPELRAALLECSEEARYELIQELLEDKSKQNNSQLPDTRGEVMSGSVFVIPPASPHHSPELPTTSIVWRRRDEFRNHIPHSRREIRNRLEVYSKTETFDRFIDKLSGKRNASSINYLKNSTRDLVSYMTTINSSGQLELMKESRQLICGDVQSGKCEASESLAVSGIDLGCRVVVVIAGTTDKLRNQTQRRFDEDILSQNETIMSPTAEGDLITHRPDNNKSRTLWGHLRRSVNLHLKDPKNSIILVVKKHQSVLEAIHELLSYIESRQLLNGQPILVIDDESDSATQNNVSDYYDGTANTEASAVHKSIVNIVNDFDSLYWGVSATVAASIFLHPKDPLFPSTAHVLDPHEFYLGAFDIFNTHVDQIVWPCEIKDFSLPNKRDEIIPFLKNQKSPPKSLVISVLNHGISGAINQRKNRKNSPHGNRHAMMINVCRRIRGQSEILRLTNLAISDAIDLLSSAQNNPEPIVDSTIYRFRENHRFFKEGEISFPKKAELIDKAIRVISHSDIRVLNNESDDELDYENPDFPDNVIVIGGSMLSRGLTIEGLRTTYFLHTPKSAVNDTTLQNARWFGPLKNDKELLSIHLNRELINRYQAIAWDDAMFRDELKRIKEEDLSLLEAEIPLHAKHLLSNKKKHMVKSENLGNQIQLARPWISTDSRVIEEFSGQLKHILKSTEFRKMSKGAMANITNEQAINFLEGITLSSSIEEVKKKNNLIQRIRIIEEKSQYSPGVNLVIRSGKQSMMVDEIPDEMKYLNLRRVKRASRDGEKVDQLISGINQGGSILTSDWFCDIEKFTGPTSEARQWRSVKHPILLIVYIIDEHTDSEKTLKGGGPWICVAAHLPHGGPGGSMISNRHRGCGYEEE